MGDAGTLTMSANELNRLEVLGRVLERRLTQRSAAERLDPGRIHTERRHPMRRRGTQHGAIADREVQVFEQGMDERAWAASSDARAGPGRPRR